MQKRIADVLAWAQDRNLIAGSWPQAQCLKTVSEVGELADNIAKGRYIEARDDIGDILVTLAILAEQLDTSLPECLDIAYNQIKDRKGQMINGVFIKEADL